MDMQLIMAGLGVGNFVLTWGLAAYMYILNQGKVTNGRLAKMEDELSDKAEEHAGRLKALETTMGTQPTHTDIAKLYESINALAATVHQLVGETRAQSDVIRMMVNNVVGKGMGGTTHEPRR
jgi:hypothetical protein